MIGDYPWGVYDHGVRWRWGAKVEAAERASKPANYAPLDDTVRLLAGYFGGSSVAGVAVNERTSLGLSAFFRAVSLISGTLASLPLPTFTQSDADRRRVASIFDDPDPDGQTVYEWKESVFAHLLLHGKAGALKVRNDAGGLQRLALVHPGSFRERLPRPDDKRRPKGGLWFDLTLEDGTPASLDAEDFFYVPGLSLNGRTGVSLLTYARVSFATSISGDEAAARLFASGAMVSGLATPDDEEDITDDVPEIRKQLDAATGGSKNAGKIAIIARRLKFQPWTMTAKDAQFLDSRQFQIEEISRWTGVPPHLLMQTEKQTSWGTGVEEQNRALGRTVLGPWARRFEARAGRLLAKPRFVEFDFSGLERSSPDKEVDTDLKQVGAGVMTIEEYRRKRGWGPLPSSAAAPASGDTSGAAGGDGSEGDGEG